MKDALPIEELLFDFIDKFKAIFFPEKWNSTFLDYSKNELFAMFYVYRKGTATMSEIADYVGVPLNTATGIVDRLEKRKVMCRQRDKADKRVVTVTITSEGMEFLKKELKVLSQYYVKLMDVISEEEKVLLIKLTGKLLDIISQEIQGCLSEKKESTRVRKISIE